jgi:uncharacterized damage-inducible protein DinB
LELQRIIGLLQNSFNGPAWHGPAVMEVLTTVTPKTATQNISTSHSIIELVLHMATWRNFVSKRLRGDDKFEVSDEENFPKGKDWTAALKALQLSQDELIKAISQFPEEKLAKIVPTRTYNFYAMLHGIIQHDIYHTGQIVLLMKNV